MPSTERCKGCSFFFSRKVFVANLGRLMRAGLKSSKARAMMPRCEKCSNLEMGRKPGVYTVPQVMINVHPGLMYLVRFPQTEWAEVYAVLQSCKASFCCVRDYEMADHFLCASTYKFPDAIAQPRGLIAAAIEKAIIQRPLDMADRFVATRNWGGQVVYATVPDPVAVTVADQSPQEQPVPEQHEPDLSVPEPEMVVQTIDAAAAGDVAISESDVVPHE